MDISSGQGQPIAPYIRAENKEIYPCLYFSSSSIVQHLRWGSLIRSEFSTCDFDGYVLIVVTFLTTVVLEVASSFLTENREFYGILITASLLP